MNLTLYFGFANFLLIVWVDGGIFLNVESMQGEKNIIFTSLLPIMYSQHFCEII